MFFEIDFLKNEDVEKVIKAVSDVLKIDTAEIKIEGKDFVIGVVGDAKTFDDYCESSYINKCLPVKDKLAVLEQNYSSMLETVGEGLSDGINYSGDYDDLLEKAKENRKKQLDKMEPVARFKAAFEDCAELTGIASDFAFRETVESSLYPKPHNFEYECIFSMGGGFIKKIEFTDAADLCDKVLESLPATRAELFAAGEISDNLPKDHSKEMDRLLAGIGEMREFCQEFKKELSLSRGGR